MEVLKIADIPASVNAVVVQIPACPIDPSTSKDVAKVAKFSCHLPDLSFSEKLQKIAKILAQATVVDNQ